MQSDIDELIELLEEEKLFVVQCIEDNIKEFEYLHAHIHTKALSKLDTQLQVLKQLKDPFYNKKDDLEKQLKLYKIWKGDIDSGIDLYYEKMIAEITEQLKKIAESGNVPLYDDQKLDDALFDIRAGHHDGFILYLNSKDNLGFTFELTQPDVLSISIDIKSVLNVEYFWGDDDEEQNILNKFTSLEFTLNQTGNKLIYRYDMGCFKDALAIKILLSRIIYDIFTYAEMDRPASLVYF
jgi:hypothetical protein